MIILRFAVDSMRKRVKFYIERVYGLLLEITTENIVVQGKIAVAAMVPTGWCFAREYKKGFKIREI